MPYVGWESKLRESKNPGGLLRVARIGVMVNYLTLVR